MDNSENNTFDIYKIFNDMFKLGDEVILIDENDYFAFGEIVEMDFTKGIKLRRKFYEPLLKSYPWETIRFMCHDGFPVKKLMAKPSDKYFVHLDSSNIVNSLRKLTVSVVCRDCGELIEESGNTYGGWSSNVGKYFECDDCKELSRRSFRGGHPFQIDNVSILTINPGNNSFYHNYIDDRFIETAILTSKDGCQGMLWDFSTIFEMEVR